MLLRIVASVALTLAYATLVEYLVHRFLDHRVIKLFGWRPKLFAHLHRAHALEHHHDYQYNLSYLYSGHGRPMDQMDYGLLAASHAAILPVYVLVWRWAGPAALAACLLYVTFHYVVLYSLIHYAMHHPGRLRSDRRGLVRAMNFHHWQHHRHQTRNFAFTIPIWDYLGGTKARPTAADVRDFERLLEHAPAALAAPVTPPPASALADE